MNIKLGPEEISSLNNDIRRKILEQLEEKDTSAKKIIEELGITKQKAHYHLKKLEQSGLVESSSKGRRKTYSKSFTRGIYGELQDPGVMKWMPREGLLVAGSPDQHGPDQVRSRDGHLLGELGQKLGSLGYSYRTVLDTEVERENLYDRPMVTLGGVLTNTVTRKLNEEFPAFFSGESFPYREIETPEKTYTDPDIGLIARKEDKLVVAGVRNSGTLAAVKAFKNGETKKNYTVVKGLDLDGDGEIDSYEVVE